MTTDLLSRDQLAERTGGLWDYVSASRLSLWLKCGLAFRLRYVDGIKTPATPQPIRWEGLSLGPGVLLSPPATRHSIGACRLGPTTG